MTKVNTITLATANLHKVREIRSILSGCGWNVEPAEDGVANVPETGSTFAENARQKATSVARSVHGIALADDSGLMVDALGGEPGVHSKRWAGEAAEDADRIAKLLEALDGVPAAERTARFVCAVCIAGPDGVLWEGEGRVEGVIAEGPSGSGGFGYDPVFHLPGHPESLASLSEAEKNAVSHRGRAMVQAAEWLRQHKTRG